MTNLPTIATAQMFIRKPVATVFEAFIDPLITTKFWFTKSTGRLEEGKAVIWTWEMYDLDVPVQVKEIIPQQKIQIVWGEGKDLSAANWDFRAIGEEGTYVTISNYDFIGSAEEVVKKVIDSTGGFTMVLAGLKAWLEHGIELNLIGDKFPEEVR
ncbi:MAG: SRPBCC family protein [Saprospiraceae bacterium]|nr:SRPBCC family protein [Saprospiraceae bacterium]